MASLLAPAATGAADSRGIAAYLLGTSGGATGLAWATQDGVRSAQAYEGRLVDFPAPQDNSGSQDGIQSGGTFTCTVVAPDDTSSGWYTLPATCQGSTFQLELVSTLTLPDGTTSEIADLRKAVCKSVNRQGNTLTLTFADIDRSALKALYPSLTFQVADWADLYAPHVGRPVPDVVGTALQVPLTYIKKPGTAYVFAGPRQIGVTTCTWNAVYRAGRVVSSSEYTAGSYTSGGYVVFTVEFTQEQKDTSGGQYEFTADVTISGNRTAPDEIKRILGLAGISTDASSFATAVTYASTNMNVDCAYVKQRAFSAILQDLLIVARGFLKVTSTGTWGIVQDKAQSSAATLYEASDLLGVTGEEFTEVPSLITVKYRPSDVNETTTRQLTRSPGGTANEVTYVCPYVRDNDVADRLVDYLGKRAAKNRNATVEVYAAQLTPGEVITINGVTCWSGVQDWTVEQITRAADRNTLKLRQYDSTVYTYAAGTLPSDYTNGYAPDYSKTPPAAPTSLTIVTNTAALNNDGAAFTTVKVRATPPSVNWATLTALITNNTTGAIALAQLQLVSGNYEASIGGLNPGDSYSYKCWATNGNNLDGAVASYGNFTAASWGTIPNLPSSLSGLQIGTLSIRWMWVPSTSTNVVRYQYRITTNGGSSWSAAVDVSETPLIYSATSYGTTYGCQVRAVDTFGNVSNWTATSSVTLGAYLSDTHITTGGVGNPSLAGSAVTYPKLNLTSHSVTYSVAAGVIAALPGYTRIFNWQISGPNQGDFQLVCVSNVGGIASGSIAAKNVSGVLATLQGDCVEAT